MPSKEEIRAAIDRYVATFSAGDRDGWLATFAPDARQDDPVGAPTNVGHEAIGAFYEGVIAGGAPTLSLREEPVICGNEVAMALRVEAGPEGGRVEIPFIIDHLVFDDDCLITSLRAFWDPASMRPIE